MSFSGCIQTVRSEIRLLPFFVLVLAMHSQCYFLICFFFFFLCHFLGVLLLGFVSSRFQVDIQHVVHCITWATSCSGC